MGRKRDHQGKPDITAHKREKSVAVKENWYPCFNPSKRHKGNGGQVQVAVYLGYNHVVVRGADDMGMERRCPTLDEAIDIYNRIGDGVTKEQLERLGLIYW